MHFYNVISQSKIGRPFHPGGRRINFLCRCCQDVSPSPFFSLFSFPPLCIHLFSFEPGVGNIKTLVPPLKELPLLLRRPRSKELQSSLLSGRLWGENGVWEQEHRMTTCFSGRAGGRVGKFPRKKWFLNRAGYSHVQKNRGGGCCSSRQRGQHMHMQSSWA